MKKAILFDADGVIIAKRDKMFSQRLSEEYNIPMEKILPFFKNEYKQCAIGKADLKREIAEYLKEWKCNMSGEEILEYWFINEMKLDHNILEKVRSLRKKGIKCYLASDNEKYRANYLSKNTGLGQYFDGLFFSCDIGSTKSDPKFFQYILKALDLRPDEILFWDDDIENVKVAKKVGLQAELYIDFQSFDKKMKNPKQ